MEDNSEKFLELDLSAEELNDQITAAFNCNGCFSSAATWGGTFSSASSLSCG